MSQPSLHPLAREAGGYNARSGDSAGGDVVMRMQTYGRACNDAFATYARSMCAPRKQFIRRIDLRRGRDRTVELDPGAAEPV